MGETSTAEQDLMDILLLAMRAHIRIHEMTISRSAYELIRPEAPLTGFALHGPGGVTIIRQRTEAGDGQS